MSELRERVEQLLYLEARLMDENRYQEWLTLFTEDALYWIPANREDIDPSREVSILYAPRPLLEQHVRRLDEGHAFAQSPRSQLRRVVSNIEIEQAPDQVSVRANFLVTELRKHKQRLHAGSSEYALVAVADQLRIRFKKVLLLGLDSPQENVTFLL